MSHAAFVTVNNHLGGLKALIIAVFGIKAGRIFSGSLQRHGNDLLVRHPFMIHAWVVLPEHLHCVLELPTGDADYATRWRLINVNPK